MEVVVAVLETPRLTYWMYSVPQCKLFAFYDGRAAFGRVPSVVLKELEAAKKAGEFSVEIRREDGVPIYVKGECVGVRLKPRLAIVRGKYGVYVLRGWEVPLAPGEDLQLIFSVV